MVELHTAYEANIDHVLSQPRLEREINGNSVLEFEKRVREETPDIMFTSWVIISGNMDNN